MPFTSRKFRKCNQAESQKLLATSMAAAKEGETTDLFVIPGPTRVPENCRALYAKEYDSPDLDPQFVKDYSSAESKLKGFLGCENEDVVIMSGS